MPRLKITIGVIPYIAAKYLPYSLKSLIEQDYENVEILLLDQEEGKWTSAKWIRENHPEWLDKVKLMEGPNLWHSGGMNKLMSMMTGDVFVVASQDMLYPKDFAGRIADFFEKHSEFEFASTRLMRWDFANLKTTNEIDSLGIQITPHHSAYEVGQTELWKNDKLSDHHYAPIFGASGALLALRKSAIEAVKVEGQVFDEMLHYKNDVDLAYRLQWADCAGALIDDLVVYHDRFISKNTKKPFWVKQQSLKGDLVFIWKNFSWGYSWLTKLKVIFYLTAKVCFVVLTNPKLFSVLVDFKKKLPEVKKWRASINRKITPKQMEQRLRGILIVGK